MKISRKTLIVGAIALLAAAAVAAKALSPVRAEYVSPQKRHIVQEVFGTGTVEARVLVTLGSKLTGRVKEVRVDEGDIVRKGQVLAVLEAEDMGALADEAGGMEKSAASKAESAKSGLDAARYALASAEAELRRNEATLALARQTFDRYAELHKKGAVSKQDLDEKKAALGEAVGQSSNLAAKREAAASDIRRAESELDAARHQFDAGRAGHSYARAKLADTEIRASIDGVVVSRSVEPGDAVVPGSKVIVIADPETVWVEANIDESISGGIRAGAPAIVFLRSDGRNAIKGAVARVAQESDRVTEELRVDVAFERKDGFRLHLGEQADVYVNGSEKDCLSIPVKAVTVRDGSTGVFIATDGKSRFVPVVTGIYAKDFVEITEGLKESDKVILLDDKLNARLKDGSRVKLTLSADGSANR